MGEPAIEKGFRKSRTAGNDRVKLLDRPSEISVRQSLRAELKVIVSRRSRLLRAKVSPRNAENEHERQKRRTLASARKVRQLVSFAPEGSSIFTNRSPGTLLKFCTIPLGHRISILFASVFWPKPKCTRLSLAER